MADERFEVNKSAVKITDGNVTITDPKVVQQLKDKGLGKIAALEKTDVSVGVVVSTKF